MFSKTHFCEYSLLQLEIYKIMQLQSLRNVLGSFKLLQLWSKHIQDFKGIYSSSGHTISELHAFCVPQRSLLTGKGTALFVNSERYRPMAHK